MNRNRAFALLLFACSSALVLGCDSAGPVAPKGTTLILTAAASKISINGSTDITIIGRKPDGNPLLRDTEIQLTTSLGTIPPLVLTDGQGVAHATLRADGRTGTATVTAATVGSGGGSGTGGTGGTTTTSGTVAVQIGETADTKPTLLISANPNNVPVTGTSTITIIARNPDGTPVAGGQTVILTSSLGTLNPSRPVTKNDGTTSATLNVGTQAGTATVSALLGSSDVATTTITIRDAATEIGLTAASNAVDRGASLNFTALVNNAQGQAVQGATVTFRIDSASAGVQATLDPTIDLTGTQGDAQTTLTVDQNSATGTLRVVASTPNGNGDPVTSSFLVTVR